MADKPEQSEARIRMTSVVKGLIWGTVATATGLVFLSLVAPTTQMPGLPVKAPAQQPSLAPAASPDRSPASPETAPAGAPSSAPRTGEIKLSPGSEFNRPPADTAPQLPGTSAPAAPGHAPAAPSSAQPDRTTADTAPAPQPMAKTGAPGAMAAPESTDATGKAPDTEQPVLPSPGAATPAQPATESAPVAPAATRPPTGIGVPVPPIGGNVPGVTTGRLPTVTNDVETRDPDTARVEAPAPTPARKGALTINSVPFRPVAGKPLFSVILIDDGSGALDRATLASFSFPVTFAIDASRKDAFTVAADYRLAGFEVVMIPPQLPEGATAKDIEVTMQAGMNKVPQAVAVIEPETTGFPADRTLLRQMVAVLSDSGHGLVTFDHGLNSAQQIAEGADLPAGLIFRVLDADAESAPTIRRYLDRAAFKATQDGSVVMLGHSTPETVSALFTWALDGKGADVQMAPISAVLLKD